MGHYTYGMIFLRAALLMLATVISAGATPGPAAERHAFVGRFVVPRNPPPTRRRTDRTGNLLVNGGFESGAINHGWYQCGEEPAYITTAHPFAGRYAEYSGVVSAGAEPRGNSGVCQRIRIPVGGGMLTAQLFQLSDESDTVYAYQEADLLDNHGNVVVNLFRTVNNRAAWVPGRWNLSAYAGRTYWLYFGVHGDGLNGLATQQFLDEVRLTPSHE
jgi:hypothetical protein